MVNGIFLDIGKMVWCYLKVVLKILRKSWYFVRLKKKIFLVKKLFWKCIFKVVIGWIL